MTFSLGFFGKLHDYPDFIKSEEISESVQEFGNWFNASFDYLAKQTGTDFKDVYPALPQLKMVVKLPNAPCAIVSLCKPSQDSSNRSAPFSIFTEADSDLYAQQLWLIPEAYGLFLRIGRLCLEDADRCFAFQRQRDTIWRLQAGLPKPLAEYLERWSTFARLTSIKGLSEMVAPSFASDFGASLMKTIFIALVPARETISSSFQAIFRFPLSLNPENQGLQVAFWMMFTEAILGNRAQEQTLLWTEEHFDIAFNYLNDQLLTLSWVPDKEHDKVWEFASMKLHESMVDRELLTRFEAAIANPDLTLAELISNTRELFLKK